MNDFGRLLAFGAGTFCIGVTFILTMLFAFSARSSGDQLEGCFSKFVGWTGLIIALGFFLYALSG